MFGGLEINSEAVYTRLFYIQERLNLKPGAAPINRSDESVVVVRTRQVLESRLKCACIYSLFSLKYFFVVIRSVPSEIKGVEEPWGRIVDGTQIILLQERMHKRKTKR